MILIKRTIPKLLVLLFASAIVFSGCEDLFVDKPDPEEEIDPNAPVYIPDEGFLNVLIWQGVDANGDSLISYAEAQVVKYLKVSEYTDCAGYYKSLSESSITDLTGIEAFINLESLVAEDSKISNLNLFSNTALKTLRIGSNELTSLDISNNIDLTRLGCQGNKLTSLDVSNNINLNYLNCGWNELTSLDISNNENLTVLRIEYMETLARVCVWTKPFPPSTVSIFYKTGSPNVYFTTECSK